MAAHQPPSQTDFNAAMAFYRQMRAAERARADLERQRQAAEAFLEQVERERVARREGAFAFSI